MARLSEAAVKQIEEICDRYKDENTPLMMILSDVQNEYGYIPLEVQEVVSEKTGIPVAEIYGVVTFYAFFSLKPKGKYVIGCCLGTACYVKGAQAVFDKLKELLGIDDPNAKGRPASDFFSPIDFYNAYTQKKHISCKQTHIPTTGKYVDISINYLAGQNVIFGILKDVTDTVDYENRIMKVKMETLTTTDEVIKKQMRVAQEIASLLGETTAETKVALLKLKKTLTEENKKN